MALGSFGDLRKPWNINKYYEYLILLFFQLHCEGSWSLSMNSRISAGPYMWHDVGIHGVGASQRIPLSVLAWNPHKGVAREISHKTGRGRRKEGPRVKRRSQSAEGGRTEKWTEQTSWKKLREADGAARTCGLRCRVGQH